MHWLDPAQRARIAGIRDNLTARIAEAEHKGWLGEVEGLKVSLAGTEDKLAQIDRRSRTTVDLGIPAATTKIEFRECWSAGSWLTFFSAIVCRLRTQAARFRLWLGSSHARFQTKSPALLRCYRATGPPGSYPDRNFTGRRSWNHFTEVGGDAMMVPAVVVESLATIATRLPGQLLDAYKHTSELKNQRYLAELAHAARAADRRHEASESALRREFLGKEAHEQREHQIRGMWEHARVELWYLAEKDVYEARKAVRPFSIPPNDLMAMLRAASHDGEQPLLLFAPFSDESKSAAESDTGPLRYRIGPRNSWATSPWSADAEPLDGLFSRPLYRGDLDVYLVREEVGNIPIVLVNGHVQAGARLWLTVSGWGLLADGAGIRVQFPHLSLPAMTGMDEETARQAQLVSHN